MNETDPRDYGEGKTPEQETSDSLQLLAGLMWIALIAALAILVYLGIR